jgi:hypothetical protein
MTKVRAKINISGMTSVGGGRTYTDIRRGDVIECDEATAAQFLECGYAQIDLKGPLGAPYKSEVPPTGEERKLMAITRPNVYGPANQDAPTEFDPRPSQWPAGEPVAEHHIVPHDYGQPETVAREDGPGSA